MSPPPSRGGRLSGAGSAAGGGAQADDLQEPALAKAGDPTLLPDLEALVEPTTRGDPGSPLRWTCKSVRRLAQALQAQGHQVSRTLVAELLNAAACKPTARPRRATATPTGMRSLAASTPKWPQ